MSKKKIEPEISTCILSEKIEKAFGKFKVNIEIFDWDCYEDRIRYKVKLKGSTTERQLFKYVPEVQSRLKLPMFHAYADRFTIYIVASSKLAKYPRLPKVLDDPDYVDILEKMELPCIIGHDIMGEPILFDLAKAPHLLLGGSTNSGKSVALQALITTIVYGESPDVVDFILIDVGATSLMPFEGLPHLSCPIVRDHMVAAYVLTALTAEMERRRNLEIDSKEEFKSLPRIVLVIDEFPALFVGLDNKRISDEPKNNISSLLQRGRHTKIHLVLVAQNPTFQNMKVDLSNITARAAFKCAKENFSKTILGEGGAEKLSGNGDLLARIPGSDGLQRVQGIYIKPEEISKIVQQICNDSWYLGRQGQKFVIPDSTLVPADAADNCDVTCHLPCTPVTPRPSSEEQLLANVILWTIGEKHVSVNALMKKFHMGNTKSCRIIRKLEDLGIVAKLEAKLPRRVVPSEFGDIPSNMLEFLQCNGVTSEAVAQAFNTKKEPHTGDEQHE